MAILISNSLYFELISKNSDKEGCSILVKGKLGHKEVTLCNLHAPPGSNIAFFKEVFSLIAALTCGMAFVQVT